MGYALARTVTLTDMEYGECGIVFAVPEDWRAEKQRSGKGWYCPNGHSRVYKESDAARYKRMLDEANANNTKLAQSVREAQEAEQRAVDERKRVEREAKRIKRRIQGGVCPCCNRTFINLGRHMKTKHPAPA